MKIGVLCCAQPLCPGPAPTDDDAPTLITLLAAPASRPGAIGGLLLLLTAFVPSIGARAVRRRPIAYGAEP